MANTNQKMALEKKGEQALRFMNVGRSEETPIEAYNCAISLIRKRNATPANYQMALELLQRAAAAGLGPAKRLEAEWRSRLGKV